MNIEKHTHFNALERRRARHRNREAAARQDAERVLGSKISKRDMKAQFATVARRVLSLQALRLELDEYERAVRLLNAKMRCEWGLQSEVPIEELAAVTWPDARSSVFGHRLDKAFLKGLIRFEFAKPIPEGKSLGERVPANDRMPLKPKLRAQPDKTVGKWIEAQIGNLSAVPANVKHFDVPNLQFSGPVFDDGMRLSEGILIDGSVLRALAPRPRTDEPVQVFIGVPGSGKTHQALQDMAKRPGRIYAYGPSTGSQEQLGRLAVKLGIEERVRVVRQLSDLRRRSRVLIDEASLMTTGMIPSIRDAKELYLAGDAGQSAAKVGQSILGALAALGAPVVELLESHRTESNSIRRLGEFVSASQSPQIPDLKRIQFAQDVKVVECDDGDDFESIVAEASKHSDCITIVWSEDMKKRLIAAGVRAYRGNMAQGAEADHVVVHMPFVWTDLNLTPFVPYISFLNGICRAKRGATIVSSADANIFLMLRSPFTERIDDLRNVRWLATMDPFMPNRHPLSNWGDDQWRLCKIIKGILGEHRASADLVGDWLYFYCNATPTRYRGAILVDQSRMGVTPEAVRAKGHDYISHFELPLDGDWDAVESQVRERFYEIWEDLRPKLQEEFRERMAQTGR